MSNNTIWRYIFNPNLSPKVLNLEQAASFAYEAGYRLMSWNGAILAITPDRKTIETKLTVAILRGEKA